MSHNLEYLLTRPGALKITTIIFGIVASILSSHSYGQSPYTDFYEDVIVPKNNTRNLPGTELELVNMTMTWIILGTSVTYLTAQSLFYIILESRLNKFIDVTFHICGGLFLFAGGTILIYSAVTIEGKGCPDFQYSSAGPTPKHHFPPLPSFLASSLHNIFSPSSSSLTYSSLHRAKALAIEDTQFCHYLGEKIVGGSLNLLNAVVYGFLAVVIQSTDLEEL